MRTTPTHPLKRERTGDRIQRPPTLVSPHARTVAFRIGPSTLLVYEFTQVVAVIARPFVVTAVSFLTNYMENPRTRFDILLSHDALTDAGAQARDRRLSGQRGQHVGFVGAQRGPRYPIGEYIASAPTVIKGYMWTDGVANHYAVVTLELQID